MASPAGRGPQEGRLSLSETEYWRDEPIRAVSQDRLDRSQIAERIARLIKDSHSSESSVVHGLVGPWGSGKSSVLAMVEEHLGQFGEEWRVLKFSPWATTDLSGLLAEFHGSIAEKLPSDASDSIKKKLGEVMSLSAPVFSLASAAVGVGDVGSPLRLIGERLLRDKSWSTQFEALSSQLAKLDLRFVVVADDVDRLQGDELLNFLRLVRLLGRFPGFSYLIAYDDVGLITSLAAAGAGTHDRRRARDFLEKFVQYPVYLPPLIEDQVLRLLNESIQPVINGSGHRFSGESDRLSFGRAWTDLLDSPRKISRFAAQLRLVLPLHTPGEVDLVDVVLLSLVRLHAPDLVGALAKMRYELTSPGRSDKPFDWDGLFEGLVDRRDQLAVREVLERVFPATSRRSKEDKYGVRAANPDYFYRYFYFGIPGDDVADDVIRQAVNSTESGEGQSLEALLSPAESPERRGVILKKVREFSGWGEGDAVTPPSALVAILKMLPTLPRNSRSFLPSPYMTSRRWAGELFVRLPFDIRREQVEEILTLDAPDEGELTLLDFAALSDLAELPPAIVEIATSRALSLVELAIENTMQGDQAQLYGAIEVWTRLPRRFCASDAKARISEAIKAGLSVDDLAARFVTVERWRGVEGADSPELGGLYWEAFDDLVPDEVEFSLPEGDLPDRLDLSWPARRRVALGELQRRQRTRR